MSWQPKTPFLATDGIIEIDDDKKCSNPTTFTSTKDFICDNNVFISLCDTP